jgi:hypothetical protein
MHECRQSSYRSCGKHVCDCCCSAKILEDEAKFGLCQKNRTTTTKKKNNDTVSLCLL